MAVRSSMADLITRTRTLIGDPEGAVLSDQQVQDALDQWRSERRWVALRPQPTFGAGGSTQYFDYYSDSGNWEADVRLQDLSYAAVTPATSELIVGHWTFSSQPSGIGLRATGKTYDLYAGAADLLEQWAATVKLDFGFVAERDQYHRDQKFAMLTELAQKYRARAQPHSGRLWQSDAAPDTDGSGVTYPAVSGSQT